LVNAGGAFSVLALAVINLLAKRAESVLEIRATPVGKLVRCACAAAPALTNKLVFSAHVGNIHDLLVRVQGSLALMHATSEEHHTDSSDNARNSRNPWGGGRLRRFLHRTQVQGVVRGSGHLNRLVAWAT